MKRFFELVRLQRRATSLAFAGLTALGLAAGIRLPAGIVPDVTFPRITVIAESGERPGDEMMRAVTRPLEESIRRVPGVREIRSKTSRGSTEINLDCAWDQDMDLTLQRVQAQVSAIRARLPAGTAVDARLMNPALFPVLGLSLTSRSQSLAELRDLAVMSLKPELSRLPGVAEVVIQGGSRLEARVVLDPAALEARGLDAARVADVLKRSSELESVGLIDANRELYLGLADARPPDLSALGAIPIPVANGPPVPLGLLAHISLEDAPEFVRYAAQSRPAVLVNVLRQPSSSTIDLANGVRGWFREHPGALPPDVRMETFYDQSLLVRDSVQSVSESLLVGALLAIVIMALFLGSFQLGWAGVAVLPGSIGFTLLGFALTRQSLNMMTLGGIAAAVGLVLDDAIVVVEHLAHRATTGSDWEGKTEAMAEIFPSLLGSSLCTIAIFAPFMLLGGVTGAFFKVLALSMTLMLSSSLLLCITVVPLLSRPRLREPGAPGRLRLRFSRLLDYATSHRWVAVLPPLVLIGAILPLHATLGSGFLPEMDEGALILDYVLPPGTALSESDRILGEVERQIDATPQVAAWSRRTGDQLGFFITEPNHGDYVLTLARKRRRAADEVAMDLRGRLEATQPAVEFEFGQLVEDVIGDLTSNPQPIEVRIFGENRGVTEEKGRQAAEILSGIRGVVDVKSGVVASGPNVAIVPGAGAALAGLSAQDLASAVTPAVSGLGAGQIIRGARAWPVRVVLPKPDVGAGAKSLAELRVPVAPGHWVRLGDLASLRVESGETEIARDNLRSMVSVTARLSHRDLGSAMAEVRQALGRRLALPRDMVIQYGGLWAEQQSSFRGLAEVLTGATAAVLLILVASFRSWRQTGAVLLVVIASLAGVFGALLAGGATFNISSFVGAIMMVGIAAENAYFLVAEHREGLKAGKSASEAAAAAALRRARPVLMTTAAGIAALAPLALGLSSGGALLRPLAVAVVGGFLTSAPLILIVLPALLAAGRPAPEST